MPPGYGNDGKSKEDKIEVPPPIILKLELDKEREVVCIAFWEADTMKFFMNVDVETAEAMAQFILRTVLPTPIRESIAIKQAVTGR